MFQVFEADLWASVLKWMKEDNHIIMGGDGNIDVIKDIFLQEFTKRNLML